MNAKKVRINLCRWKSKCASRSGTKISKFFGHCFTRAAFYDRLDPRRPVLKDPLNGDLLPF